MILGALWLWVAPAHAGSGTLGALVGMRTAPEAGLEQDSEWEPEFEPAAAAAVVGRWRAAASSGAWVGVEGEAWGLAPEGEASLLALGPRAGIGLPVGEGSFELAARYDARLYLVEGDASSGRAEALAAIRGSSSADVVPEASLIAVDRHYPNTPAWSFRSAEAQGGVTAYSGVVRVRGLAGFQGNLTPGAAGSQLRGTLEAGVAPRGWELWSAYQAILAFEGEVQAAARPAFTPVGEYSADVDAVSGGGFLQHKLELGVAANLSKWTVRVSALGRVRSSDRDDRGAFPLAGHAQLDVERALSERVTATATAGTSAAALAGQRSYMDHYGWVGVRWAFGR